MSHQLGLEDYFGLGSHYCEEGDLDGALKVYDRLFEIIGMKVDQRCSGEYANPKTIKVVGEFPRCVCTRYSILDGRKVSLLLQYCYLSPEDIERMTETGKEISRQATDVMRNILMRFRPLTREEEEHIGSQVNQQFEEKKREYLHTYRPHIHQLFLFSGTWSRARAKDMLLIPGSAQRYGMENHFKEVVKCNGMFNRFIDLPDIPVLPEDPLVLIMKTLFEKENMRERFPTSPL